MKCIGFFEFCVIRTLPLCTHLMSCNSWCADPPPPSPSLGPPGTSALEFVCRLQYELSWTQFPELVRFSVVTKSEGKTHLVLTFTVRVYI